MTTEHAPTRPVARGERRRELLLLLGCAMTAAGTLHAQQSAMPVIGFLGSTSRGAPFVAAFLEGLAETGYVEGQNAASSIVGQRAAMIGYPLWPPNSSNAGSM